MLEEKKENKTLTIKILKPVNLSVDLKKYSAKGKGDIKKYSQDEIIEDVHIKYLERFAKFPEHIQILEGGQ